MLEVPIYDTTYSFEIAFSYIVQQIRSTYYFLMP